MKQNATLPEEYVTVLKDVDRSSALFLAHVVSLRLQGWPLRALADPLGVSRVTIRNWQSKGSARQDILQLTTQITTPPVPLDAKGTGVTTKKIPKGIPERDRTRIAELSPIAAKNNQWVRKDSEERLASQELDSLVETYVIQRNVSATVFAQAAGVSRRAIMQRVERVTQ